MVEEKRALGKGMNKDSNQNHSSILERLRLGETVSADFLEFNSLLLKLSKFHELRPVKFNIKIDGDEITLQPIKHLKTLQRVLK